MVKRASGKGVRYYIPFWVVPSLAPLGVLIHLSITINDSEVTHESTFAVLAIVLAVSSFSFLGCAVDGACTWPRTFPIEFMIVQLVLLFFGIVAVRHLVALNARVVHTVEVPRALVNGAPQLQLPTTTTRAQAGAASMPIIEYYTMMKGSCCCPEPVTTKSDCEHAIDTLGLTRSKPWADTYGEIPGGCSVSDGKNDMHWNTATAGKKRADMTPICIRTQWMPAPLSIAQKAAADRAGLAQTSNDAISSQPAVDYPAEAPNAQDYQSSGAQSDVPALPPEGVAGMLETTTQTLAPWPSVVLDPALKVNAWKDAGDGYCEDGNTHKEFNALFSKPKTLQECADVGFKDPGSIAFDFSRTDGGCDLRYPAGALYLNRPGFSWFAWGGGEGQPVASGKQKHDTETRCYLKVASGTEQHIEEASGHALSTDLHPYYQSLIHEYSFNPVATERGEKVNIILVHSPFQNEKEEEYYQKLKDELLFIGISSLEDFPLPPPNPFSPKFPRDKYVGLFPGFLNMFRNPQDIYPSHVKVLDMSQSDFSLPYDAGEPPTKKYDFTFSGSDQDIGADTVSECSGWSMFCKNWTFAKQALEVMCGEFGLTGVLVATKDKQGEKRCGIPTSCEGKVLQTSYLDQSDFFDYVKQSRFLFLPNVHDASPRVATQALALDVPLFMNWNLIGGWKYLNEKTGEFFHDLSDFRASLRKLLDNAKAGGVYTPRQFVNEHYGDDVAGAKFKNWVEDNFKDRVMLPEGTQLLLPSS